jgi:hypothetical protein
LTASFTNSAPMPVEPPVMSANLSGIVSSLLVEIA